MNEVGKVILVGAGPGDPGLITVKGLQAIHEADCLVYDRLVSPELLKEAKAGCELVFVGKEPGRHAVPQDAINRLLVEKARAHRLVVRLKGGDPFVFGRGGEELVFLRERGVACEVVPGVTSAIAGPAAAAIPVTHRGLARGFHVFTAHGTDDALEAMDFAALVKAGGTSVFLMGLSLVGEIAARFMSAGAAPATPAAVISRATTAEQREVVGTLADIAARVAEARLVSPAVIVIGAAVGSCR